MIQRPEGYIGSFAKMAQTCQGSGRLTAVVLTILLLSGGAVATAQTTIDPRTAEFAASADHSRTTAAGEPLVQAYRIEFYLGGATEPFQWASLGKPATDADGLIRVDLSAIFLGWPLPGAEYTSTVAAVGPGGATRSARSNSFTFSGSCSYTVAPASLNTGSMAGSGSTGVTTAEGCSWLSTSNASWLAITAGANGRGSDTVAFSFSANTDTSARTGTLTVAGQTITVAQAGASCTFSVSPDTVTAPPAGGAQTSILTTTGGCSWLATSHASWLTITSAAAGVGSGSVVYNVAPNLATVSRTGTLSIAGWTVSVHQAAGSNDDPPPPPPGNLRVIP